MKKYIATFLLTSTLFVFNAIAQKPSQGQITGEKVPLYCGSTGTSTADSTRLPILFQAKIQGLTPGASYKYYTRFISLSDTASMSTTGAGIPIVMKKNGTWRTLPSPDLSTAGAHDTFTMALGLGEYVGWFGALYTNDSRFTPGKFIYPMLILEEIGSGSANTQKIYLTDSIEVLKFSSTQAAGNGTAIYGSSFVKGKSIVLLYDNSNGTTNRPVTIAYAESEGLSFSNMQSWYSGKVNAKAGAWGSILPNNLSNGITRIESRDAGFDTIIYANIENDATWGSDSTINVHGGATTPVSIKSDYAPLLKPEIEFVGNLTTIVEANTTVNMLVRRRYGNADSSKISAFVNAGTATNGVDYSLITPFPIVFKPYGEVIDTIKVKIIDDFASEPTENVAVRLSNPVNAHIGFQTTYSVDITDNDVPVITFDKKTQTVKENNGLLSVKLRINSGSTTPTNVNVYVKSKSDSTFIPADFKLGSSNKDTTVQFPGGNVVDSLSFDISIVNDMNSEDRSDTVVLVLRNPTSPATIGKDSLFTLIIEDDDAPPLYSFSKKSITVKENVGSVKIRINRQSGNIFQSDITLTYSGDSKFAQPGDDYTFTPQLITFFNTDPDSFIYTIPIINDNLSEPMEDAVFIIRNAFNARIGKPDTIRITILDDDLPEYKINTVTAAKSPNFIVDSMNVRCALRGTVYGVNMGPVGTTKGLSFTLRDNTGGIQVFQASGGTKGYTVNEGDSIQIYGKISQFNGMAQLTQIDTLYKLGTSLNITSPRVVNILNESTESDIVKYNLVKLSNPAKWPTSPMAANTQITLKVLTPNDSFDIIIDSETDIDGKPAPSVYFNVAGIGSQNDNTSPYTSNYAMFPRKYSDFTNLIVPIFGFTAPTSLAKELSDSSEGFDLQCANLTSNQQINLVIKGGTASRGTDYQSNLNRLFILTAAKPTITVKFKMNDDNIKDPNETIIWAIRDNAWGTLIGPDSVHTVTIVDDETTGLTENLLSSKTKVYPNPASNNVTVLSEEAVINKIVVYDLNGRVVKTFDALDTNETVLSLDGLESGLYTLQIHSDQGVYTKALSVL